MVAWLSLQSNIVSLCRYVPSKCCIHIRPVLNFTWINVCIKVVRPKRAYWSQRHSPPRFESQSGHIEKDCQFANRRSMIFSIIPEPDTSKKVNISWRCIRHHSKSMKSTLNKYRNFIVVSYISCGIFMRTLH